MPLYVADYLSDAAHLSTLEHGAYLMLIMTYWQRGESLPADDKKLARIARLGPREWAKMKPQISEFFEVTCDKWVHIRVEKELANVRAKSLKNRKGGLARAKQMHSERSADAQPSDTDTDNTLDKSNGPSPSLGKSLWDDSLAFYGSGKRSLIAKWIKIHSQEAFLDVMTDCQRVDPLDRVSWTEKALRNRKAEQAKKFVVPV